MNTRYPPRLANRRVIAELQTRGGGCWANFHRSVIFLIFQHSQLHVSYWIPRSYLTGVAAHSHTLPHCAGMVFTNNVYFTSYLCMYIFVEVIFRYMILLISNTRDALPHFADMVFTNHVYFTSYLCMYTCLWNSYFGILYCSHLTRLTQFISIQRILSGELTR